MSLAELEAASAEATKLFKTSQVDHATAMEKASKLAIESAQAVQVHKLAIPPWRGHLSWGFDCVGWKWVMYIPLPPSYRGGVSQCRQICGNMTKSRRGRLTPSARLVDLGGVCPGSFRALLTAYYYYYYF
jgi:hypothetical protein